jgi:hypothetical protein
MDAPSTSQITEDEHELQNMMTEHSHATIAGAT